MQKDGKEPSQQQREELLDAHEKTRLELFRTEPLHEESNWRLILVQLDDFGPPPAPPPFFFERRREELRRRGFRDADIAEMERIARELVGPYNHHIPYSELWPDEQLLEPAVDWHFAEGKIDGAERERLLAFVRRCSGGA